MFNKVAREAVDSKQGARQRGNPNIGGDVEPLAKTPTDGNSDIAAPHPTKRSPKPKAGAAPNTGDRRSPRLQLHYDGGK